MFRNLVQISRFLTPAKIRDGWAKFSRCVIEFDLGPYMWYNFYDVLLGLDIRGGIFQRPQQNLRQLRLLTYIGRPNKD